MAESFDVLIVGAGIAGASVAANLAADCKVAIVERENQPGYHATGRSAALFSEIYGNAAIRALSRASRAHLFEPPAGFCETALVSPRGALYIARPGQSASFEAMAALPDVAAGTSIVEEAAARRLSPLLREGYAAQALYEPQARDIDVSALHQGYLRQMRGRGGRLMLESEVLALERRGAVWRARTTQGEFEAPIVVDAAGAWADQLASLAGLSGVDLTPRRRTVALIEVPDPADIAGSAMTIDIDETFYFKPDAGLLLISPADETPVEAGDAQPEEMDLALAVARVEAATHLEVRRIRAKWAGLRSFVADRSPVVGFDPAAAGFFWLAGQGGYGIQTAPALGRLAAALVLGKAATADVMDFGLDLADLDPGRVISDLAVVQHTEAR
jgi:D-arginine dehydrogenase